VVTLTQLARLVDELPGIQPKGHARQSQQQVFSHGLAGDQAIVLIDHAYAVADGVSGSMEGDGLAVHEDVPSIGPIETGQDAHERGLAGSIFAQQGVYFAPAGREIDAPVGHDTRKGLVDPDHSHRLVALGGRHLTRKTIAVRYADAPALVVALVLVIV